MAFVNYVPLVVCNPGGLFQPADFYYFLQLAELGVSGNDFGADGFGQGCGAGVGQAKFEVGFE